VLTKPIKEESINGNNTWKMVNPFLAQESLLSAGPVTWLPGHVLVRNTSVSAMLAWEVPRSHPVGFLVALDHVSQEQLVLCHISLQC